MDVYIGFGLLSAGVVVVVFMIFDGWLKNRNLSHSKLSGLNDRTSEDPDFAINNDLQENFIENIENISPARVIYDFSNETKHSELADLCDGNLKPEAYIDNMHQAEEDMHESQTLISEQIIEEERKPHPQTVAKTNEVFSAAHEKNKLFPPNLLILSIMAKKDSRFESYDLLQAISAAGMQYGEMNIFHYYQTTPVGKIALFSLASANKPGDFDLNNIAEFSCTGLMLFMDIAQTPDPQYAFRLMLDVAERLAEDLDGVLCSDPMTQWNEKIAWQYHQKIMQYKTVSKHDNKTYI